jgi:arylsulfatase A-like enzyme
VRRARVAACLLPLACFASACPGRPDAPPNLLLITIDTLRADRLACYGGPPDVGEAICALADGGTRFAWAFSAAAHTAPSVASLLTSRYPSHHGVTQRASSRLRPTDTTVAELLGAVGYTTAAIVSNPILDPVRNFGQGFAVYEVRTASPERNRRLRQGLAAATTDAALAWAERAAREPWFLWVHYQDPHGPYDPPGGSAVRDAPGDPVLPVLDGQSGHRGIPAYQALPGLHTVAAYEARYLDEIRQLDPQVARLVAGLDARGRPPALLLTADHGEAFGEDGFYFAHGHSVGLDQIRVPLLWRPPQPGRARVVTTPVSLLDVAPTLLRAAGVQAADVLRGRPLPVHGETPPDVERPLYAEHARRVAVVRGRSYWSRNREPIPSEPWYPPRQATLEGDGALPAYTLPGRGAAPPLEPELARFLEQTRAEPPGEEGEAPEALRRQLRALGYAD